MASVPAPPPGGSRASGAYTYTSSGAGTFSIVVTGDGTTITVPEAALCRAWSASTTDHPGDAPSTTLKGISPTARSPPECGIAPRLRVRGLTLNVS